MDAIFEAILQSKINVTRLLRSHPEFANARMSEDYLVEVIPHWLYVGDSGLHLAAAALLVDVAKVLLEAGADPTAENRRGATPLHYCCDPRPQIGGWSRGAQEEMIALLVERGAHIDQPDRGGATPLHRAVRARSPGAVAKLLKLGARVDCRLGKRGSSPLHLAVQPIGAGGTAGAIEEQLEIVSILLKSGADPTLADAAGRSPRDWARTDNIQLALGGEIRTPSRPKKSERRTTNR